MNIIGDVALFTHGTINGNRTRKGTSREKGDGAREMIKIEEKMRRNSKGTATESEIRTDAEQRKRLQYDKDNRKTTHERK